MALLFGDIACDMRNTDHFTVPAEDGGDGEGHVPGGAVFVEANGFEMDDLPAIPQALEDIRLFVLAIGGYQFAHRAADDLFGGVAEEALGSGIPALNDAGGRLSD